MKIKEGDYVRIKSCRNIERKSIYSWHRDNPDTEYIAKVMSVSKYSKYHNDCHLNIIHPYSDMANYHDAWFYYTKEIKEVVKLEDLPDDIRRKILVMEI